MVTHSDKLLGGPELEPTQSDFKVYCFYSFIIISVVVLGPHLAVLMVYLTSVLRGPFKVPDFKPRSAEYKASFLTTVIFF